MTSGLVRNLFIFGVSCAAAMAASATTRIAEKACFMELSLLSASGLIQREDDQRSAKVRIVGQRLSESYRSQPVTAFGQPLGETDSCPSSHTRQNGDILLALVHVSDGVADNARGRVELIENLSRSRIDCFKPAAQCPVEQDATVGGQRPAVVLKQVVDGPLSLARDLVERYKPAAHVAMVRRIHAEQGADIGKSA